MSHAKNDNRKRTRGAFRTMSELNDSSKQGTDPAAKDEYASLKGEEALEAAGVG